MKKSANFFLSSLLCICLCGCGSNMQEAQNNPSKDITPPITDEIKQVEEQNPNEEPEDTGDTEDTVQKQLYPADVVFLKFPLTHGFDPETPEDFTIIQEFTGGYCYAPDYSQNYSQMISLYDTEKMDKDTLCAFIVKMGDYIGENEYCPAQKEGESDDDYLRRKIACAKEVLAKHGAYAIKNYPFCKEGRWILGEESFTENHNLAYIFSANRGDFAVAATRDTIYNLCKEGKDVDGFYFRFLSAIRPDIIETAEAYGYTDYWDYYSIFYKERSNSLQLPLTVNIWR